MFGTGFFIGLVGGMHCVLMCTPVVMALNPNRTLGNQTLYHSGRIVIYAGMGLVAGAVGTGLSWFGFQQFISILMGITIILITVFPATRARFYKTSLSSVPVKSLRRFLHSSGPTRPLIAGMLNGLLPCGLVYVGLTGALALGNTMDGLMFMIGFGVGTLPWLTGAVAVVGQLPLKFRYQASKVIPALALSVGILFILRGLALNIPFISPALQSLGLPEAMTTCGG